MRTLIYLEESKLAPAGGPYAVGFYIKKVLERNGCSDIDFIQDGASGSVTPVKVSGFFMKFIQKAYRIINRYRKYKRILSGKGTPKVDFSQYDIVHFHKTVDMLECKDALEKFNGIVLLTSHSPVPLSKEIYGDHLLPFERKFLTGLYSKLISFDKYAFNRADFIHFPCEEAEEPYFNNWDEYIEIRKRRHAHYFYIPTGIPSACAKRTRMEVREELGIADEEFCISYVGRHNSVKGYDKLKVIGRRILEEPDTWVVCAGREEPLKGLEDKHWIEVGWTNDAHSYISASDVFILPNKETYFDIVMLEVLSLGKIVIASRTGGNRYFDKLAPNGVYLYDNVDEAVSILRKIKAMDRRERERIGSLNKEMYLNNFTDEVFVKRYLNYISNLRSASANDNN